MISLDTNQLLGKSTDGALLHMLRKVAEQTGHDLVLPEVVVEEYMAHYAHEVELAAKKVRDGVDELRRLIPRWAADPALLRSVEEDAADLRRGKLGELFRVHPTPGGAWRESMIREASRRPPAKSSWENGKAGGARDVAIWLTVLDACQSSREATYFVTENSSDFGRNGSLRPELAKEADDRLGHDADLLRYCPGIPALMSQLGIENAQPPDDGTISSAGQVLAAIETALAGDDVPFEFMSGIANSALKVAGGFGRVQDLRFKRLQGKVEAYRIDDGAWACARGVWEGWTSLWVLWKPELGPSASGRQVRLDFTVSATVVMQINDQGAIVAAEVTDRSRLVAVEV